MAELDSRVLRIEVNGINVISGDERKGKPRDLFWPWFAARPAAGGLVGLARPGYRQ